MGAEAFGITMQFTQTGACRMVREILVNYHEIRLTPETINPGSVMSGEYCDGDHIIELQLRRMGRNHCSLAVRFSLCSYSTIDSVFINLITDILASMEAEVWLMTSALRQKVHYLPGDSKWLIAALPDEILEMRRYWQTLFGTKQGPVRVKDSFSYVGLR